MIVSYFPNMFENKSDFIVFMPSLLVYSMASSAMSAASTLFTATELKAFSA